MARRARLGALDILRQITREEPKPLYVLSGPETFLIEEIVTALREAVLGAEASDWNEDRLRADDVDAQTAVLRADTPPMGSAQRLVTVRAVEKWREKDYTALLRYIERPNPTTVLVLIGSTVDGRTKWVKAAKKAGVVAKIETLRERELPPVVARIAKKQGKLLGTEAAQVLMMRCGEDLQTLASEIEKLALFVGDGDEITTQDVERAAAGAGSAKIFALCDAVGGGDVSTALRLLHNELTAGDRSGPIRVNAMLSRHFRLLMKAREAGGDLARVLGLPPFIASQYGRQARRFNELALQRAHRVLYESDQHLKGGSRLPPAAVIEQTIISLSAL